MPTSPPAIPDWLVAAFPSDSELSASVIFTRLAVAMLLGAAVTLVYRVTRREQPAAGSDLSQTLLLLTLVIAMVTLAVGGNVARAFSLVGALAIVRFRMVVNDPRDTAFVILAVAVGLAVGAGFLVVPVLGLPLAAAVAWAFTAGADRRPGPRACDVVLTLDATADPTAPEVVLATFLDGLQTRRIETLTKFPGTEFTFHGGLKPSANARELVARLVRCPGVTAVDLRLGDGVRA